MNPFQDKIAIVTGAGSGIGRALALALAKRGARVAVSGRRAENVEETLSLIRAAGGKGEAVLADVSREADVLDLVRGTAGRFGRLDFIFNNAGISVAGEARDLSLSQWKKVIDVNLMGVLYGTAAAYETMVAQGFGHIVNISSLAGLLPFPIKAPYSATKHAIVGLSTTLRAEAEDLGVKVSVVCPGVVKTAIWDTTPIMRATSEDVRRIVRVPMFAADKAAKKTLEGVAKNRAIIAFPFHAKMGWWLYRLHPGLLSPVGRKMIRDFRKVRRKDA